MSFHRSQILFVSCDNNDTIQANEPRSQQKAKHILRRFHLIRVIIARGDVMMEIVPSIDDIVDPLTKLFAQEVFEHQYKRMGLMHKSNWF